MTSVQDIAHVTYSMFQESGGAQYPADETPVSFKDTVTWFKTNITTLWMSNIKELSIASVSFLC